MSRNANRKRKPNNRVANDERKVQETNGETSQNQEVSKETSANSSNSTGINDPEWYKRFPELAFGSGNLPFADQLGSSLRIGDMNIRGSNASNQTINVAPDILKNRAIPGVCTLKTKPSYGFNNTLNDPLNVAAQQFYTNVRYVNSGRKNYDPADLMIAECAIADLYAFINWAQRIYGYAYMYSQRNLYIDMALIEANHVNSADIREHLANFRYWLNTYISRVSAFAVPNDINIFRRRAYMFAHLYTESTTMNVKDQLYQFAPDGFFQFRLDSTGKGMLKYIPLDEWAITQWTLNNIITYGEMLIDNISGDEDFGLISGDIIKAYGSSILRLEPVPESLFIMPEYEEFTLSQMRNADIVAVSRGSTALSYHLDGNSAEIFTLGDVYQANNGNLITAEGVNGAAGTFIEGNIMAYEPGIITVTNPMPSVDDVLESTRLKTCVWPTATDRIDANDNIVALATGSDVVVAVEIWKYAFNSSNQWRLTKDVINHSGVTPGTGADNPYWEIEMFHWAPILWSTEFTLNSGTGEYDLTQAVPLCNVDNYTTLSWNNVANLHETALISLLSVPGVATLVG